MTTKTFELRLIPEELHESIRSLAFAENTSMNTFILETLEQAVIALQTSCKLWTGKVVEGYGIVERPSGKTSAHRHAYDELYGPQPYSLVIHHRCRNKLCVNVGHLVALSNTQHLKRHARLHANKVNQD